jgi:hypothetical protein
MENTSIRARLDQFEKSNHSVATTSSIPRTSASRRDKSVVGAIKKKTFSSNVSLDSHSGHSTASWGSASSSGSTPFRAPLRRGKKPDPVKPNVGEQNQSTLAHAKNSLHTTTAGRSFDESSDSVQGQNAGALAAMLARLHDPQHSATVTSLYQRVEAARGFPPARRLSLRDNEIVANMIKVIRNDPSVTSIRVVGDERFEQIKKTLLLEFAESLALNLHLESLTLQGVGLGNDFLTSLAQSIKSNFSLLAVDLSGNAFTSEGLVEFCCGLVENQSLRVANLRQQRSPIMTHAEKEAMEVLQKNRHLIDIGIPASTPECQSMMERFEERNAGSPRQTNFDGKLIQYLTEEAKRAEELYNLQVWEEKAQELTDEEWEHIYSLSKLARSYKIHCQLNNTPVEQESKPSSSSTGKSIEQAIAATLDDLASDGSFLTNEYISKFLVEEKDSDALVFAFNGQFRMFQKYDTAHPCRPRIMKKFVDTLLGHPDCKRIYWLNLTDSFLGNDAVEYLCSQCLADPQLLPKLNILDLETNYITDPGMLAVAKCVEHPQVWNFLQTLRLENQRHALGNRMAALSSISELSLAKAICRNRSVIRLSLCVRNLRERHKIQGYVSRNIDWLRQSRGRFEVSEHKPKNDLEELIDKIANNDSSVDGLVDLSRDKRFLTLHARQVEKLARGMAGNTNITELKLNSLQLDDSFVSALAQSLQTNHKLRVLSLEGNAVSGQGIISLFGVLETNGSLQEIQLRHQTKVMTSDEEDDLAELLQGNQTVVRLSLDLRSSLARHHVDALLRRNQDVQRQKNQPSAGTKSKKKKKNDMELFFDKVAQNDPNVTEIDLVNDRLFKGLSKASRLEAAASLAQNTHVIKVKLNRLDLDDEFAVALAASVATNDTLQVLNLDSNTLTGGGILALLASVRPKKEGLRELQLRHQAKAMASTDEEKVMDELEENESLVKLGLDIRNALVKSKIQQKLTRNNDLLRKKRRSKQS